MSITSIFVFSQSGSSYKVVVVDGHRLGQLRKLDQKKFEWIHELDFHVLAIMNVGNMSTCMCTVSVFYIRYTGDPHYKEI